MPAQLIALTDGPNILLDKPILLLGRHPECDIQIESRKISRRHCCIALVNDHLVVRDLGSTNGIRINGVRVQEGNLRSNDELTIGNSRYKVRWETMDIQMPQPREKEPVLPKESPRVGRVESLDDDVLESCEEPVPLEEPDAESPPIRPVTQLDPPDPNESVILPDDLELAPISDNIPPRRTP
jgi:pSer/pThr/pTyr-binding forkhead associated (FHA) protein